MNEAQALARLEKEAETWTWVYIICQKCDLWWYAAADIKGLKRDIKDAIYRGTMRGDRVIRRLPGEPIPEGNCKCGGGE